MCAWTRSRTHPDYHFVVLEQDPCAIQRKVSQKSPLLVPMPSSSTSILLLAGWRACMCLWSRREHKGAYVTGSRYSCLHQDRVTGEEHWEISYLPLAQRKLGHLYGICAVYSLKRFLVLIARWLCSRQCAVVPGNREDKYN